MLNGKFIVLHKTDESRGMGIVLGDNTYTTLEEVYVNGHGEIVSDEEMSTLDENQISSRSIEIKQIPIQIQELNVAWQADKYRTQSAFYAERASDLEFIQTFEEYMENKPSVLEVMDHLYEMASEFTEPVNIRDIALNVATKFDVDISELEEVEDIDDEEEQIEEVESEEGEALEVEEGDGQTETEPELVE